MGMVSAIEAAAETSDPKPLTEDEQMTLAIYDRAEANVG